MTRGDRFVAFAHGGFLGTMVGCAVGVGIALWRGDPALLAILVALTAFSWTMWRASR